MQVQTPDAHTKYMFVLNMYNFQVKNNVKRFIIQLQKTVTIWNSIIKLIEGMTQFDKCII